MDNIMDPFWDAFKDIDLSSLVFRDNPFLKLFGDKLWVNYRNTTSGCEVFVKEIQLIEWEI